MLLGLFENPGTATHRRTPGKLYSPEAGPITLFGLSTIVSFLFLNSSKCLDEIYPGWPLASCVAFSKSKMTTKYTRKPPNLLPKFKI